MNKGELIDAMAKDAKSSTKKYGKMGNHPNITQHNSFISNSRQKSGKTSRNPQTGKEIKSARNTNGLPSGKRTYKTNKGNQKAQARHNWMNNPSRATSSKQASGQSKDLHLRKRPGRAQGDPIPGIGITKEQGFAQDGDDLHIRKRPGRSKTIGNYTTINSGEKLRKRPGSTKYKSTLLNKNIDSLKATDYNSSRSNKSY